MESVIVYEWKKKYESTCYSKKPTALVHIADAFVHNWGYIWGFWGQLWPGPDMVHRNASDGQGVTQMT